MTERERLKLISISDAELTLIKQCLSDYLTAARLRSEWCNRAMDYSTIQQLHDAILSLVS